MRRFTRALILAAMMAGIGGPASADITGFLGTTSTPTTRAARGAAIGFGLLIVGFEFEFSNTSEEPIEGAPSLRTGMGNVLLQTPVAIFGLQPYFTTGGGLYREALGTRAETHFGVNSGGGVKVSLLGPVRARVDYRVFHLRGDPLHDTVHRFYAGINLNV
jgi:hypothetical protein